MYQRDRNQSLFLGGERISGNEVRNQNGRLNYALETGAEAWFAC
jgi:hypothetical protein